MSEAFAGIPLADPTPARARPASAVILWRDAPGGRAGREVFWVRRGANLTFAGGFYAFPGGKVDRADAAIPVAGEQSAEAAALFVSAVRELFEETGVLLARGALRTSRDTCARARQEILEKRLLFADFLSDSGLTLDTADLLPAGRWITPPFAPVRFDARFFLAALPRGQEAAVWPGELADGEWIHCEDALLAWRDGRALLHPPSRYAIECLAAAPPPACLAALRAPPYCVDHVATRIDFHEHLYLVPLRTPTLPPATHTNTYVVGDRLLAIVDPGSGDEGELEKLFSIVSAMEQEDRRVTQIWLTHHHGDHIGGLEACAARWNVPVLAHPLTAPRVGVPAVPLHDGELLFGRWRALHTPGHARGHLCFFDETTRALLAGDMYSSVSTIVIDPPEGDLSDYLAQLRRLIALAPRTLFPAHGAPVPDAVGKLEGYLSHRAAREAKVLRALCADALSLLAVTERAYDDTPSFLHPLAARSCLASLEKLCREGRALREGDCWRAA